ncbi:MAG: segregation/condensation protein A [Deltaproteobacteria bacterium]|nr:segregation/condensation protein A [Deltaproteobacteria bacterium]MBW2394250.1 segregation/condensation protein A [Deltaproteobacteria bacterium]
MSFATEPDAAESGAQPLGSAYSVKLEVFEGPLDLLLHLIRLNEVDIAEISIADIAKQYIEYLALMEELNLDVAGEYLLMAATLAWIKSRMILPRNDEEEEDEGLDPRAELVARLLEYQRFKEVSEELGERRLLGRDIYAATPPELEGTPEGEREIAVDLVRLVEAFRRVLKEAKPESHAHEVEAETVTVRDCMTVIMDVLGDVAQIEFEQVFLQSPSGAAPSRPVLVTTFLALLELVRLEAVRIYQGTDEDSVPQGPIHLRRADEGEVAWNERVAEIM